MAHIIDETLKLAVRSETLPNPQPIENCDAEMVTATRSADTSGLFHCPLVNREVGIKDLTCGFNCEHRRRV